MEYCEVLDNRTGICYSGCRSVVLKIYRWDTFLGLSGLLGVAITSYLPPNVVVAPLQFPVLWWDRDYKERKTMPEGPCSDDGTDRDPNRMFRPPVLNDDVTIDDGGGRAK